MDELTLKGERYISSKRAAEVTGYTKDYIGQMCRTEKIDARLVGRNWYVNERSIFAHKKHGNSENFHAVNVSSQQPTESPRYITGPAAESPYYKKDPRPLIPDPVKHREEIINLKMADNEASRSIEIKTGESQSRKPTPEHSEYIQEHARAQAGMRTSRGWIAPSEKKLRKERTRFSRQFPILLPLSVAACIALIVGLLSFERIERYEGVSGGVSAIVRSSHLQFAGF